jgi:hypothetical protein
MVQSQGDQDKVGIFVILDKSQEISNPESMSSRGRDVIGGMQRRFVYQITSLDYYELVEY